MHRLVLFLAITLLFFLATSLPAQEIYLNIGQTEDLTSHERATRWGVEYRQGLGEHLAVGLTYINEGHVPEHHRDGYEPQIWLRTNVLERRLSLAAGVGPYFYFDTVLPDDGPSGNQHGWGAVYSLAATWYMESGLLFELRANYIQAVNSFDSVSVTGGIGYQLDRPPREGPVDRPPRETASATGRELTLLGGETRLNRGDAHETGAEGLEYRVGVAPHVDLTAGVLNEGPRKGNRYGINGQAWIVRTYFNDRLAFGIGGGPYLAYDQDRGNNGSTTVNALIGVTAGFHFTDHWLGRFIWDRVLTNYDHDADIFLVGIGYCF